MSKVLNKVLIQIYLFYVFTDYQADQVDHAKPASVYYVPSNKSKIKHPVFKPNATVVVSLFSTVIFIITENWM